jgi:NTE family protein
LQKLTMGTELEATVDAKPRKVALVLGGGGAFGVVQAACIQAAFERGFRPDFVVGTSVGALNGAWVAMHPDQPERLLEIWAGLGAMKVLRLSPFRLARHALRRSSLCPNEIVPFLLDAHVPGTAFEDTAIPLAVVATNLSRGGKRVFRSGPLCTAIAASTAIPGVFEPVELDGELYVDGCLTASLDLVTALEMGATEILGIDLTPAAEHCRPRTVAGVLRQSLSILSRSTTDAMEATVARQATVQVVRPDLRKLSPWRLEVAAEQIERHLSEARAAMASALDDDGNVLPRFGAAVEPAVRASHAATATRLWERMQSRLSLRRVRPATSTAPVH